MKPREIFTVSVRAYYPQEENGVNKKYLQKTVCCLCLEKQPSFCITRVLRSWDSEVRNDPWNIDKTGINEQFTEDFWCSDCSFRSILPMVHRLITLLWSITFTVQLMWHLYLKCTQDHHVNAEIIHTRHREAGTFFWRTCHCLVLNLMTKHLL